MALNELIHIQYNSGIPGEDFIHGCYLDKVSGWGVLSFARYLETEEIWTQKCQVSLQD